MINEQTEGATAFGGQDAKGYKDDLTVQSKEDLRKAIKLNLSRERKEAVAQGAERIAWTTGVQQNERCDLSKQVDEIGWQKNENGTYNITPKKDGSVVGTRDMMANLRYRDWETDRKSTRLNSSHSGESRMPSSA